MRLKAGGVAPLFSRPDIFGASVELEKMRGAPILLSFHRFAACPLCNLRMHRMIEAYPRLERAGLHVLAFFQSPEALIRENVGRQDAPFPIISDPDKEVYDLYGVHSSMAAVGRASLRRMPAAIASVARGFWPRKMDGDMALVPAAFLIDRELVIRVAYYGSDVGDHLPLARVEAFAGLGPTVASEVTT